MIGKKTNSTTMHKKKIRKKYTEMSTSCLSLASGARVIFFSFSFSVYL